MTSASLAVRGFACVLEPWTNSFGGLDKMPGTSEEVCTQDLGGSAEHVPSFQFLLLLSCLGKDLSKIAGVLQATTDQWRDQNSRKQWSSKLGKTACMHAKQEKHIAMVTWTMTVMATTYNTM